MTEGPVPVSYPAVMRDYLGGDVPGAITPLKVTSWHAEAGKLYEALARHGLGAVVIPQKADKSPLVSFVGPKDDCKWPAAGALRQSEWSRAGGLGLLIYEDVVVLDFDKMDIVQERVDFFVSCIPMMESAPREVSGGGVHVFFAATELSRTVFPAKTKAPDIDIITVTGTGSGHNLNVAPSGNKRWVAGCSIFDLAPPPIPDELVRLLKDARDQMMAAAKATARDAGPGGEPAKRSDTPAEHRPVARQSDLGDAGWLSRAGDVLGTKLFSLVGLVDCKPARHGNGWYSRSDCPCPFPGCAKVHRNNYVIGLNKFGSVSLTYLNADEHYPGTMVVELDTAAIRAMQDAWAAAGETGLVRGDGCFYKSAVASGGERVTWRVFLPWEVRDGGRSLNSVPRELWGAAHSDLWGAGAAQLTPMMDVATILADVALAEHIKLTVKDFLGESGPSASGKTLCSVQFTSADACHVCKKVHDKPYTVALTKTYGEKVTIYAPCVDGKGQLVYKQARRQTDAELSAWAEDDDVRERAAKKVKAASGTTPFTDALLKVVGAETWTAKLEAATDALDVANGKPVGTSAHYRGATSLPDGRSGQPRAVVRIEYTKAGGFKLLTHYASSGKTFEVKPTGAAGKERPGAVKEFDFRAA